MKIFLFMGTRPEVIKLAPVLEAIQNLETPFELCLVATGQHKEMFEQTLEDFALRVTFSLGVMTPEQSLASLTARLFASVGNLLLEEKPDLVIVQGDTTTVMVVSVCAFYQGIACAHVEAGLRSGDIAVPFPEEFNRRVVALTSALHFAPTERAAAALIMEGIAPERILVTGNTGIDALLWMVERNTKDAPALPHELQILIDQGRRFILVTGHRRENFGEGLERICQAIKTLVRQYPRLCFVYPLHLNPNVGAVVNNRLREQENIFLCSPLSYRQFVYMMQHCWCVLTDSGGVQEEAPYLDKPVLVMRELTERPEGLEAGCAKLVGTDAADIVAGIAELMRNPEVYAAMAKAHPPYGDGQAAKRIARRIFQSALHVKCSLNNEQNSPASIPQQGVEGNSL